MKLLSETATLLHKEFTIEWRSKNTLFSLLLFSGGTAFIAYLSFFLKTKAINAITWNAILWILLLFNAIHGMGKSFNQEGQGRHYYYYYIANPTSIYLSKLIYNTGLMLLLSLLSFTFFNTVFNIDIQNKAYFFLGLSLGSFGFSSTLTLVSAIASKASSSATLMAVLSIPVIIPLLLVLIRYSNRAIDGIAPSFLLNDIWLLTGINMIIISVSFVLFPYLWRS